MLTVPWPQTHRSLLSAVAAPVLLIGGWTLAAALRSDEFSQTTDTISALAAIGAPHRWLMTTVFVLVGVCYLWTAWGLREAGLTGRVLLAFGGVATCAVAAVPLPAQGPSAAHTGVASLAFLALAVWPLFAASSRRPEPWVLHPVTCLTAAAVLLGLLVWFGVALNTGDLVGLSERVAAGAQALWPAVVVLGCRGTGYRQAATELPRSVPG